MLIQNGEDPDNFEFESSNLERLKKDLVAKMERNSMDLKKEIEQIFVGLQLLGIKNLPENWHLGVGNAEFETRAGR